MSEFEIPTTTHGFWSVLWRDEQSNYVDNQIKIFLSQQKAIDYIKTCWPELLDKSNSRLEDLISGAEIELDSGDRYVSLIFAWFH